MVYSLFFLFWIAVKISMVLVLVLVIRTVGSPYGELRPVTRIIVLCPINHPGRCDLTGQNLTQDQFPRFTANKTYCIVNLDRNYFHYVPRGTFVDQPELMYFTLERNQLTVIDANMLPRQPKLDFFNAAHNFIVIVHPLAFKGASNVKALVLNDNEILHFPREILCDLKHLNELYLHNNNLTTFEITIGCEPENLTDLSLSGNPFCCDARMVWMKGLERLGKLSWHTGHNGIPLTPTCVNFPDAHWTNISDWDLSNGAYIFSWLCSHCDSCRLQTKFGARECFYPCVSLCSQGGWLPSMHHRPHDQGVCIQRGSVSRGVCIQGVGYNSPPLPWIHGILQDMVNIRMHSCSFILGMKRKRKRHFFRMGS